MDLSANPKLHFNSNKNSEEDLFQLPKLQVLSLNEVSPSIVISEKVELQVRLRRYGTEESIPNFGVSEFLGQDQVLSILDLVMLDFRNMENHSLYALFEGKNGNSLAKYFLLFSSFISFSFLFFQKKKKKSILDIYNVGLLINSRLNFDQILTLKML